MSELNVHEQLTLLELAKRHDPDGNLATIIESLAEENEILLDAPWLQANDRWGHKTVRRTTLPSGSWRKLNAGVGTEASKTQEVREGIGMLETYAEYDKALVDSADNSESFRNTEVRAFLEGLGQTLADTIIYGDITLYPERFQGLAPRLGTVDADGNVLDQGGSGSDCTSVYVVQWGPTKVHMIYPQGNKNFGVEHEDLGQVTKVDGSGDMWEVYRDHFKVYAGMVVRDDRCLGRIGSIEVSGSSNVFDEDNLITLLNRMPKSGQGGRVYVNDTMQTAMEIKLKDKTNVYFTPGKGGGLFGEPVLYVRGLPIRKVDAIKNTEAAI